MPQSGREIRERRGANGEGEREQELKNNENNVQKLET